MTSRRTVAVGALAFFLSGFTALLYQVVWQRLLGLFSGADVYAATITVGAFMGGLGFGSLAGGWAADRLSRHSSLIAFALVEVAVGLFGFVSAGLYYDVLYLRLGHLSAQPALLPVLLFVSLLWPTFFMGMSLPLLARALTRTLDAAAPTLGVLYGVNALGASAGALVTTWWLLPTRGLDGSLRLAALVNLAVALAAGLLARRMDAAESQPARAASSAKPADSPATPARTFQFPVWLGLYTLSGFLALSLEIVWFRTLSVTAKATAFTFGTLLAVYLGGLGLGSAIGSVIVGRVRDAAMTFLLVQAAVGISAGALLILLLSSLDAPAFAWLSQYLGQYETLDLGRVSAEGPGRLLLLYFGIPLFLIGLPTTLMGVSFPLLQRVAQTDFSRLGRRVGALMVGNILGSTIGAILTGWLGLRYLGTAGTLKAIVATCAVFGIVALAGSAGRRRAAAAGIVAILACAGLATALPPASELWASLHGVESRRIVWAEDETGLSVIKLGQSLEGRAEVYVNGLGQSWFPYGEIHTALGALPALMHPSPREAAVIGLGSGDTVFGLAGRPDIERITCIEIIRSQLDTLRRFDRIYGYPGLRALIADPRIEHVTGDGRLYAMRSERGFDIIEADALRPGSAYSGNLYSDRYFMLLRDRLKPGGLAVTWAPTPRIRRTFLSVFPYVVRFEDIMVGSRDPIALDLSTVRARAADPRIRDYYASASVDIALLLDRYAGRPEVFVAGDDRSTFDDLNTDLAPRDEFSVPFLDRRR